AARRPLRGASRSRRRRASVRPRTGRCGAGPARPARLRRRRGRRVESVRSCARAYPDPIAACRPAGCFFTCGGGDMVDRRTDFALLLLRLVLGVVFVAHGAQKMFGMFGGHGLSDFSEHIGKMGMPPIVAVLVAVGELFGGLGVLAGLLTRIAALGPIA